MAPFSSTSTPTSRQSEDLSREVDVGYGYRISGHTLNILDTLTSKSKWLRTLLVAVFKEDAGLYRFYQPRTEKERLRKFPHSFIQLAQGLYPALLRRLGYSAAAQETEMRRLGADLADRAKAIDRARGEAATGMKRKRQPEPEEDDSEPEELLDPTTGEFIQVARGIVDPVTGEIIF